MPMLPDKPAPKVGAFHEYVEPDGIVPEGV